MITLRNKSYGYGQGNPAYTITVPAESISQSYPITASESLPPISVSAQQQFTPVVSTSTFSLSSLFSGNNKYLLMGVGVLLLYKYLFK
jgi:hypothetical protein